MPGPLDGVRVLDLTSVVMGPYSTQILADFGADVIKVESPEGDNMRWVWPFRNPGMGHIFLNANRNKRSVVLDLKKAPAREACLALAKRADVLVYNIRPQAMARLRLSYEDVKAVNPKIIYVGCFGYSQRGPYAAKAAYDDLIQGAAGVPWLLKKQGADSPRFAPIIIADRSVGQQVASAVSAALYYREKTGKGQRVDVPMFEHLLQIVLGEHLGGYTFEPAIGEAGYARMLSPDRRPYQTKDGYVCALIYNDKQWRSFFQAIGRLDMQDERFRDHASRIRHIREIYTEVAEIFATRTIAEWMHLLEEADIPYTPLRTIDDLVADPHLGAIGFFTEAEHPSEGKIKSMRTPAAWSDSKTEPARPAPTLGQHSREILQELGLAEQSIADLFAKGIVEGPQPAAAMAAKADLV